MTTTAAWAQVAAALPEAKGIAWDTCHKIYVLMDQEQFDLMASYDYDPLIPVTDTYEALQTLKEWYGDSCGLRFINAVKTVKGDPNEGFIDLIAQLDEEE
jgi:hypothetical protein